LDTLQAAVLAAKLPFLDEWTAARRRLVARYGQLLADQTLILPGVADGAEPAWHLYVVRTPGTFVRDELVAHLNEQGIGAGVHYPVPLHLQPAYRDLGYRAGELPVTEVVAATCLSLPLYPELSEEQQDRVVQAVAAFLAERVAA
jgi:dTDP-4-amino-4,6-dideoxygalactose transaminase